MSQYQDVVERYIAAWNETDVERRRALIARTFTENASYLDPIMQASGQAELDGLIGGVHAKFPGYRFALKGAADAHHNVVRFCWGLAEAGSEAQIEGTDVALVAADGRLEQVTGFLDRVPAA